MTEATLKRTENGEAKTSKMSDATPASFLTSTTTIAVTAIRIGCLIKWDWMPVESSTILRLLHNRDLAPFWTSTLIRPFETWNHLREARAVRHLFGDQFRDAYTGGTVHLPPLVLAAFEPLLDLPPMVTGTVAHLVDLAIALQFLRLGKLVLQELRDPWEDELQPRVPESLRPSLENAIPISEEEVVYTNELPPKMEVEENDADDSKTTEENNSNPQTQETTETIAEEAQPCNPYFAWSEFPLLAAQLYYYSPFTALASGLGTTHHSFQNIWLLFLLWSLHKACSEPSVVPLSAFFLALASYTELHYFVYLLPLSLWLNRRAESSGQTSQVPALLFFYIFWFVCLQGLTVLLVGPSQYRLVLKSSFWHTFTWKNLHPNFSVLWYLNMELFERYRTYFSILIGGLPYLLLLPLTIRLHRYPMVLTTTIWMLFTLIRPTTTLVDANIAACFAVLCPRSLARMRIATTLIPALALMVPISLYVVTLWMWLETDVGEANFTFFQCLAYCAFLATTFLEFSGASVRRDKVLRLTEKLCWKAAKAKTEAKEETADEKED